MPEDSGDGSGGLRLKVLYQSLRESKKRPICAAIKQATSQFCKPLVRFHGEFPQFLKSSQIRIFLGAGWTTGVQKWSDEDLLAEPYFAFEMYTSNSQSPGSHLEIYLLAKQKQCYHLKCQLVALRIRSSQHLTSPLILASLCLEFNIATSRTLVGTRYHRKCLLEILGHVRPKSFQDAVSIARSLKSNYLWIDSLCIIHNSPGDWMAESVKMAEYALEHT